MYVVVAKVVGVHGVKGHVKLLSFTEPHTNILNFYRFFTQKGDDWLPIKLSELQQKGQHIVAIVEDCHDRDKAKIFNNINIAVLRSDFPEIDEEVLGYYWTDLEGLKVYNKEDKFLGHVDSLFNTGSNDIMLVKNQGVEILIPYITDHYIISVNLQDKKIIVDWDENW